MSQSIFEPEGTTHLTQAQVAQFVTDGFVVVPGLVDPDRVGAGLKELKDKTGIVPCDAATWPADKAGMHVGQEGFAFDRSACVSPRMEAVVRELGGRLSHASEAWGPFCDFRKRGASGLNRAGRTLMARAKGMASRCTRPIFICW